MDNDDLDKFQLATIRLGDAIFGFFAGQHSLTVIDDIRGTRELIKGVSALYANKGLIDEINYDDNKNTLIQFIRLGSNFAKHAHKDADRAMPYSDEVRVLGLNQAVREYLELFDALEGGGFLDNFGTNSPIRTRLLAEVFQTWFQQEYLKVQAMAQELSYQNLKALTETFTEHAASISDLNQRLGQVAMSLGVVKSVVRQSPEYDEMSRAHGEVFQLIVADNDMWPLPYDGGIALKRIPEIDVRFVVPQPSTYLPKL